MVQEATMKKWTSRIASFCRSELFRYAVGGAGTTIWNIVCFHALYSLDIDYRIANIAAIITTKVLAYIINKLYVFKSRCHSKKELAVEIGKYTATRFITALVDYFGLILLIAIAPWPPVVSKIIISVVIVTLNYVFGRFSVFANTRAKKGDVMEVQPEGNYYNKYKSTNPIAKRLMHGFFDSLYNLIDSLSLNTVYEAGCGEGEVSHRLSMRYQNVAFSASDLSKSKILQAKKEYPEIQFETASIYALPYPDNQFDLVIVSEVLEHLEAPEKALAETLRISGRYVLLSVPNEPVWRIANMARGKYLKRLGNTPGHIQHWSKKSFVRLVEKQCTIIRVASPFPWTALLCEKNVGV